MIDTKFAYGKGFRCAQNAKNRIDAGKIALHQSGNVLFRKFMAWNYFRTGAQPVCWTCRVLRGDEVVVAVC